MFNSFQNKNGNINDLHKNKMLGVLYSFLCLVVNFLLEFENNVISQVMLSLSIVN